MKQEDLLKLVRKEFKDQPFIANDRGDNIGFGQVRNYIDHTRDAFAFDNLNSEKFRERYQGDYMLSKWEEFYSPSLAKMKDIQDKELTYAMDKDVVNAQSGREDSHAISYEDKVKAKHGFETAYFNYRDKEIMNQPHVKEDIQNLEETYLAYRRSQGLTYTPEKVEQEVKVDNWLEEHKKKIELNKAIQNGSTQRKVDLIHDRGLNTESEFKPNRATPELAKLAEESGMFMRTDYIKNKVAEKISETAFENTKNHFPEYQAKINKRVEVIAKTNPAIIEQRKVAEANLTVATKEVKEQEQSSWDDNLAWAKNYKPSDQVNKEHIVSMPITEAQKLEATQKHNKAEVKSNVVDMRSRAEIKTDSSGWDEMEQWAKNRPRIEQKTPMLSLVDIKQSNEATGPKREPIALNYEIPGKHIEWNDQTPKAQQIIFAQEQRLRDKGENVKSIIPENDLKALIQEHQKTHKQDNVAQQEPAVFKFDMEHTKQKMHGMRQGMKMRAV